VDWIIWLRVGCCGDYRNERLCSIKGQTLITWVTIIISEPLFHGVTIWIENFRYTDEQIKYRRQSLLFVNVHKKRWGNNYCNYLKILPVRANSAFVACNCIVLLILTFGNLISWGQFKSQRNLREKELAEY
jgi:hypothetical protein